MIIKNIEKFAFQRSYNRGLSSAMQNAFHTTRVRARVCGYIPVSICVIYTKLKIFIVVYFIDSLCVIIYTLYISVYSKKEEISAA